MMAKERVGSMNFKHKIFCVIFIFAVIFTSCNKEEKELLSKAQEPILGKWAESGSEQTAVEFLPKSVLVFKYKGAKGIETTMGEWKKVSEEHYVISVSIMDVPIVIQWKDVDFLSDTSLSVLINEKSCIFNKLD